MKFSIASLATVLSALAVGVSADVWIPPVIEPHAGAVWVSGQIYNITWYALFYCFDAWSHG